MRIVAQPPCIDPDEAKQLLGALAGRPDGRGDLASSKSDRADLQFVDGVERIHGTLRHEGDIAPTSCPALVQRQRRQVTALKQDLPSRMRAVFAITPISARPMVVLPQPSRPRGQRGSPKER